MNDWFKMLIVFLTGIVILCFVGYSTCMTWTPSFDLGNYTHPTAAECVKMSVWWWP